MMHEYYNTREFSLGTFLGRRYCIGYICISLNSTFVSAVCIFSSPYTLSLNITLLYWLYTKTFASAVLDTIIHLYWLNPLVLRVKKLANYL